jgi:aspartate aminotransferase-like enzyme
MKREFMRNILLTLGPITTTVTVKHAMLKDICPREKDFSKIITSVRKDLVKIAGGDSKYDCVLFGCSGTGVMEAV